MSSETMHDLLITFKQTCIFRSFCIRKSRISSNTLVTQRIECPTEYFFPPKPSIMFLETCNLALDRGEETSYVHHEAWFAHHLSYYYNLARYHTAEYEHMVLEKSITFCELACFKEV